MSRRIRSTLLAAAVLLSLGTTPGCNADPTGVRLDRDADLTILFVGNSLTYTNDLPGLVRTLGHAVGTTISTAAVAKPNYALEDHWYGDIAATISSARPDVVVMQQGPSSLPQNGEHLVEWAGRLGEAVRDADAQPALMMVWPDRSRAGFFGDVRAHYRAAAVAAEGTFIPAGDVFSRLIPIPGMDPYGPDAFHPSMLGSVAAAAAVVRTLTGTPMAGLLGTRVESGEGGDPTIVLTESEASVLWPLVDEVVSGN